VPACRHPCAPLRHPETGAIIGASPFMNSLIVSIALIFGVSGGAYGVGAGTLKGATGIIGVMQKAIGSLAGLILLLFVIAQFLACFNHSNMATLAAVGLAGILLEAKLPAIWLLAGEAAPRVMLAALFAITAVLGMFISNTATAVLMAPVAIAIATDLGLSPHPFAMIVAIASSAAFMTPVSSPVNTLVAGPGNDTFADFAKVGVPFTIVVMLLSVVMVPWVLPLQ
jgi:p-aminobenzoyl-glutamate transporter AbgT